MPCGLTNSPGGRWPGTSARPKRGRYLTNHSQPPAVPRPSPMDRAAGRRCQGASSMCIPPAGTTIAWVGFDEIDEHTSAPLTAGSCGHDKREPRSRRRPYVSSPSAEGRACRLTDQGWYELQTLFGRAASDGMARLTRSARVRWPTESGHWWSAPMAGGTPCERVPCSSLSLWSAANSLRLAVCRRPEQEAHASE
jgi:hypothetical protein